MRPLFVQKSPVNSWIKLVCCLVVLAIGILSTHSAEAARLKKKAARAHDRPIYAINIASYPEPFDSSVLPKDRALRKYRLYTVKVKSKGRLWRGVRIGFFSSRKAAQKALRRLPGKYRGGFIVKVSKRERALAKRTASKAAAGKSRPGSEFDHFRTGFPLTGAHDRIECESCHARGIFKGTPKRCAGCHRRGGRVSASEKPLSHISTGAPCDQCHLTATWTSVRMDHGVVTGQCSSCHNRTIATGKGPRHVASSNFCDDCHRTNTWASARFDHGSVTGQCSSCHNGGTATGKPGSHIASSNVCDECHRTSAWTPARFDHGSVTGQCSNCHNGSTATGKPASHIASSNICDECHRTSAWVPTSFDHGSVTGQCSNCHNGSTATGKPGSHIASSNVCDECHSTSAWVPASFDHGSVTGQCSNCHNGSTATGKPGSHIASSNVCDECHRTSAWVPASFDHGSVTGQCSSCHNGFTATGKPGSHIASSNVCDECHSTSAWIPASFDHGSVTGQCSNCHNGSTATGKPGSHFVTTVQCDECHSTNSWLTAISYRHVSGEYPGDHNSGVVCLDCHQSNTQSATWKSSAYRPDCAGCHAGDFKPDKHKLVDSPRVYYTVSELRDCSGSCHRYTDSSRTTIERSRSGKHHASDGGW